MREEDREILQEAVNRSAGGDDFDEMLLRATKKHLPRVYNKRFAAVLEEILNEADERGLSNRQAALSLLKTAGPMIPVPERPPILRPPAAFPAVATSRVAPPVPAEEPPSGTIPDELRPKPEASSVAPEAAPPAIAPGEEEAGGTDDSVEKLPETSKIVDLGGTRPESLPPELQDKLKKLVKAQKKRQAWEEGAPDEETEPGLFFKGAQRAPPIVPLKRPDKKPEDAGSGPTAGDTEEEDLEEPDNAAAPVEPKKK